MEKSIEELKTLRQKYGLGLALMRQVCSYYDNNNDIEKVLHDLSGSLMIMDGPDIFQAYLENHSDMRRPRFRFIDLFCGISGFHQAMRSIGGECVFACDIDKKCRETYFDNYGIEPAGDITKVAAENIPEHDVLCGGFPCQSFSKAGKRLGFLDKTKGTLFFDIMRIIDKHHPKYVLLENVRNLASHDNGNTWRTIRESLESAGYSVTKEPVIFSPHYLGIPQHRERVFIMAQRKDLGELPEFFFDMTEKVPCCVKSVLQRDVPEKYNLSADEIALFEHWNRFLQNTKTRDGKLPGFPIWTEYFPDSSVNDRK